MFNTAKRLIENNYNVVYNHNTQIPKTFVCPNCLEKVKQFTDNSILQRRAAKNIVIGAKIEDNYSSTLAVCSKCDFTKSK